MTPVSPVISEEYADREAVYAKNQPEYIPLPVIRSSEGVVLSRWKITESERQAVSEGADVFLSVWTFNRSLRPVRLEIGECDRDLAAIAADMGLVP